MTRTQYTGPRMPTAMSALIETTGQSKGAKTAQSRVQRRKDERQQKKSMRLQPRKAPVRSSNGRPSQQTAPRASHAAPAKSSVAPKTLELHTESESDLALDLDDDVDDSAESELDLESDDPEDAVGPGRISKTSRSRMEQDDAEIAALERKLGIKKKKGKADDLFDDGLEDLFGDLGDLEEDETEDIPIYKRKSAEDDEWLRQKRRKIQPDVQGFDGFSDSPGSGESDGEDGDDDQELHSTPVATTSATNAKGRDDTYIKPVRENPYIAPAPAPAPTSESPAPTSESPAPTGKYIPPSLRKATNVEDESVLRLNRSIKGLINRLSESNLLAILSSLEALYLNNARQHVTSGLINTLLALITESSTLSDVFIVLHGALIAALYRVVGVDFGAQLLEQIVVMLDSSSSVGAQKPINLISLLAIMYSFQVISCDIIYGLIRDYTKRFTEDDTEMLLRIVRLCGPQLRQDDPSALKDVVTMLKTSVANKGTSNLSVRQSFMIEIITDLKNNRLKSGMASSVSRMESTTRMKKLLGSVKSKATRASEPLRISLDDVRDTEKKGKWWLVGASYHDPAKMAAAHQSDNGESVLPTEPVTASKSESTETNLLDLARELGMNTDVRKRIFMAVMTAVDYTHATLQIQKLSLKKNQIKEIPAVLVRCVVAEKMYNPFYGNLARELCSKHHLREVKAAFQFTLWDQCEQLDEDVEDDDTTGTDRLEIPQIVALAKFYAKLVRSEALRITILKKFDFALLKSRIRLFLEVLIVFIILDKSKAPDGGPSVVSTLAEVRDVDDMIPGFRYFLKNVVAKTEIPEKKRQKRKVAEICAEVDQQLAQSAV